jgi:hypothetical protein
MAAPRFQPVRSRGPSAGLRALAATVAALVVSAPLLDWLHAGSVSHVACAEHGELIDADGPGAQRAANAPHQHQDGGVLLAEHDRSIPLEAGQAHEHCAVIAHSRLRAKTSEPVAFADVAAQPPALPQTQPEPPRLRSQALYRLAPKSSPPLV